MPIIKESSYQCPLLFQNPHLNTIFPALFRKVKSVKYQSIRIETPDDDFLDLSFSEIGSKNAVLVLHGLEGQSDRHYMKGMVRQFNDHGWDAVAMNHRGCSGVMNRKLQSYHMGWTSDLDVVINKIAPKYETIVLVGFSLGGNVILKYLGENSGKVKNKIKKGIVFSVPCHIPSANLEFNKPKNKLYLWRFLKSLNAKVIEKSILFPDKLRIDPESMPKSFDEFDEQFTAPIHGFESAEDYWVKNSSKQFLEQIKIPVLMVQAQDDTFLSPECYPTEIAEQHAFLYLEMPKNGGHVGFTTFGNQGTYWSEKRALEFAESIL